MVPALNVHSGTVPRAILRYSSSGDIMAIADHLREVLAVPRWYHTCFFSTPAIPVGTVEQVPGSLSESSTRSTHPKPASGSIAAVRLVGFRYQSGFFLEHATAQPGEARKSDSGAGETAVRWTRGPITLARNHFPRDRRIPLAPSGGRIGLPSIPRPFAGNCLPVTGCPSSLRSNGLIVIRGRSHGSFLRVCQQAKLFLGYDLARELLLLLPSMSGEIGVVGTAP